MAELSPEQVTRIEQGIVRSPYGKLLGVELGELADPLDQRPEGWRVSDRSSFILVRLSRDKAARRYLV